MTRIPKLKPEDMNSEQRRIYDGVMATTGRIGGPATAYIYSPNLWETTNRVSAHFEDCTLSAAQLRLVGILTARYWDASFPWAAQARMGLSAGLGQAVVDAVNAREKPSFDDEKDAAVYDVASETLENHSVSDATFARCAEILGYPTMVDTVGAVGHYCKVALMANLAGAVGPDDAPSKLKE